MRAVPTDPDLAMDPSALKTMLADDQAAGLVPLLVCATAGTTSTGAFDPVEAIAEVTEPLGIWLHVDAAWAGSAAIDPEYRWVIAGVERADSYLFNPHKWLMVNFDCSAFWVRDRAALTEALSIVPEYLRTARSDAGEVVDFRDWQVPLGRRFRALKLWFVIRHYGVEGLRHHVRRHIELAHAFARWVRADDRFELAIPPPLNLVCFRHRGGDDVNQRLMDRLNATGRLYLTHTRLGGRLTLRLCVGQTCTEERHVRAAWDLIRQSVES